MEFSKKLKKLRLEKGLSQQKLADMIFVSRSAVAKWENGLGLPSEESYKRWQQFLACQKSFLEQNTQSRSLLKKTRESKIYLISCASP